MLRVSIRSSAGIGFLALEGNEMGQNTEHISVEAFPATELTIHNDGRQDISGKEGESFVPWINAQDTQQQ